MYINKEQEILFYRMVGITLPHKNRFGSFQNFFRYFSWTLTFYRTIGRKLYFFKTF